MNQPEEKRKARAEEEAKRLLRKAGEIERELKFLRPICAYCHNGDREVGRDYPTLPCGNGDLGVRAQYMDGSIILYEKRRAASGQIPVNFCPMCGRQIRR